MTPLDQTTAFWLREIIILMLCAIGGLVVAPAIRAGFDGDPNSIGLYLYAGLVAWACVEAMFSLKRTVMFSLGSRAKV